MTTLPGAGVGLLSQSLSIAFDSGGYGGHAHTENFRPEQRVKETP